MDSTIVLQFFDFFQEFIELCQAVHWPDNNTSELEIKNAFLMSQHVHKCLDRLQKRNLLDSFMCSLTKNNNACDSTLKCCLSDPPKYLLSKIINSKSKITQMDIAFKIFVEIFSEEKLENNLADILLEAASKQVLLKNLFLEIPKQKIRDFKSAIFLSELNKCDDTKECFLTMFNDCNESTVDLIVSSSINNDTQYIIAVTNIIKHLINATKCKHQSHKKFWKLLFSVDQNNLVDMCVKHSDWYKVVVKALLDSGRLLREAMSAEYFYIDLTYSELCRNVNTLCANASLKAEFFEILTECEEDFSFWQHML